MSLTAKILTSINLPEQVDVEISDSVRGTTEVLTVDFHAAMQELAELGAVNLQEVDPAELISMACAVAKHRAIDQYLMSLGIDPHKDVKMMNELPEQQK
ncbi:MAG: hypothetical protein GX100_13865 [candidate division WS1 bacterium]|jgi:hypothetical protein|nr:hypothetical protein [candidate division WS1 bacterium]